MDKVLILDGESPAAIECVLTLAPRCRLHLATPTGRFSLFGRLVERNLLQPESPEALKKWIEELFRSENYQLIIPATEVSLLTLKRSDIDPALRSRVVIPDESSIDLALDKFRTVELARKLGVPAPRTVLVTSPDETTRRVRYPIVIKPLRSKQYVQGEMRSFAARICQDELSRASAYAELLPCTPAVEQEYFRGRGIGIEVMFECGRLRWWFAHERIHALPVTGGASTYRRSIAPPPAILHATEALLSSLRWHGVAMVEFNVSENGDFRLLEINPRLWGSLPLAVAAGVDFPSGLLRLARGEPLGEQPLYRHDLYMRHFANDMVWFAKSWRERRNPLRVKALDWSDWLALLRPLNGSEHWDFFRWRFPSIWWKCTRSSLGGFRRNKRRRKAVEATSTNWMKLQPTWQTSEIQRVLVLCHGNICRSPVVERLLAGPQRQVRSAGFLHAGRRPPEDWTRVVQNALGLDLREHRSNRVDAVQIRWADLILLMDAANWQMLWKAFPDAMGKAVLLGYASHDATADEVEIRDPYELPELAMHSVALKLKVCADRLLQQQTIVVPDREIAVRAC